MRDLRTLIALLALIVAWRAYLDRPNSLTLGRALLATTPLLLR
jgi:hypothetical protein